MREYTDNWLLEEEDIDKEILTRRYREDKHEWYICETTYSEETRYKVDIEHESIQQRYKI